MRKGGYPVALNQISSNSASKTYVEDLLVPSDSQVYVCHTTYSDSATVIKILSNSVSEVQVK
jgi:hypothetical protein